MPNQSGVWTLSQQFQARGQGLWPASPGAPTIGAATLVTTTSATVAFTAPACTGTPPGITGYQAISTPGCITATGASSPITVTGLTAGTAYTFKVQAQNASGYGAFSGSSNSVQAKVPGAPTIGTATAGSSSATVAFTAPACTGSPAGITGYTATSTPGCFTGTGASSPITVSGLTNGTAYTFKVKAQNAYGFGPCSASSNSVTPAVPAGQAAYTSPGTYSWVAPAGVTSVSVVAVGGGYGGGGGLSYGNNISVTPGSSYSVVVGCISGTSSFINTCTLFAAGGGANSGGGGGGSARNGGGSGGNRVSSGGGGAGGYSGNGGTGGYCAFPCGFNGSGGGGGGGGAFYFQVGLCAGGGGGVGILGEGASGQRGGRGSGGRGGSCGSNGQTSAAAGCGSPGGYYGGGGGGYNLFGPAGTGAVRIIWPGTTRQFPSTCTGNK